MSSHTGLEEDVATYAVAQPEPIHDSLADILKDRLAQYAGPLPTTESELKTFFFALIEEGAREAASDVDVDGVVASQLIAECLFRLKDLLATRLHVYALLICLGKIADSEEVVARELGVTKAVSLGVNTLAVLPMWLNGALKLAPPLSTAWV